MRGCFKVNFPKTSVIAFLTKITPEFFQPARKFPIPSLVPYSRVDKPFGQFPCCLAGFRTPYKCQLKDEQRVCLGAPVLLRLFFEMTQSLKNRKPSFRPNVNGFCALFLF